MPSAFAPGRLELIGNHTDYNEGFVLALAINLGITAAGEIRSDDKVILRSEGFGEDTFSIQHIEKNPHVPWSNHIKGVLLELRKLGAPLGGFEAQYSSTLPHGVGMSSSAAVSVVTAFLAQKLFHFQLGDPADPASRMALASLCRNAEHDFVGVRCGLLDQATSVMGQKDHAVFLDCRFESAEIIPLPPDVCFVVCDTGVKHMLLGSKYNTRRNECEEAVQLLKLNKIEAKALRDLNQAKIQEHSGLFTPRVFQRAMHVTGENERVLQARDALFHHDLKKLGRLMYESHESSRDAFENSTPFLDMLVDIARKLPGCFGSRLTGGGFGGGTISLVERSSAEAFAQELMSQYRTQSGKEPRAFILEASEGAR